MTTILAFALWVNGYSPNDLHIAAYFATEAECVRVQKLVNEKTRWTRCIQANYIVPGGKP